MSEDNTIYEGYCMHCRIKRQIKNAEILTMKTGMKAVKGTCVICGTNIFKILPKQK